MKMRKLISLVLALALVFSLAAPVMAAAPTDQEKAGDRLLELGIIAGDASGNLQLDKTLTRAEVTVLLARLNGMGDAAELLHNQPSVFSDVKTGEWYTGWINLASSQGWIKGDPQGTFRPNDPVQYREAVTMIVKVLGYDDNLVGVWPTNYLAKATSLGLVKGLSYTDAKASAVRGDIFLVASRALDEKVVYWSSSENEFLYKESKSGGKIANITLLENALNLVKYEEMIVSDIALTSSSLKGNEVKLTAKDGSVGNGTYTLKVGKPLDYFGKEVTVWVDDKDSEIWAIQVDTDDSDIYMDTIAVDGKTDSKKVDLDVADKTIDIARNANVYVNGKSVDETKLKDYEGAYGRFVLNDDGDVAYAILFDFDGDQGVVVETDGKVITYVDDRAKKDDNELDLEDYDDGYYVFDQNLNEIDLSKVAANNGLFYGEHKDDDIAYVLVSNATVTGKLERLSEGKARIDGKTYDLAKPAIYTDNNGDDYNLFDLDDAEGMIGEDVTAVLNLSGDILLLSGASNETSGSLYGVVTYAEKSGSSKVTIFNKEGKEVEYRFADRGDMPNGIVHDDYYGEGSSLKYALIKYKLDKSSEIYSDFKTDSKENGIVVTVASATPTTSSQIDTIFGDDTKVQFGKATKKSDKDYVVVNDENFYFDKDTVIMTTIDDKELDPSLMKYDTLYSNAIGSGDYGYAVIFGEPGKTADAIFFVHNDFDGADDDYFYGILSADPVKDGDDWYADIDLLGEGKKEIKLDDRAGLYKGSLIGYKVNNSGKAVVLDTFNAKKNVSDYNNDDDNGGIIANIASGATFPADRKAVFYQVQDVDGYSIKVNNKNYKVASDVIVYALDKDDNYGVDKKSSYSKVNENDGVVLLLNDDGKVAGILLVDDLFKDGKAPEPGVGEGTVTYINVEEGLIEVDGKVLELHRRVRLIDADGKTLAIGPKEVAKELKEGDILDKITEKDGIVTEMKLAEEKDDEDPVDPDPEPGKEVTATYEAKLNPIAQKYAVAIDLSDVKKNDKVTIAIIDGKEYEVEIFEERILVNGVFDEKPSEVKVVVEGKTITATEAK